MLRAAVTAAVGGYVWFIVTASDPSAAIPGRGALVAAATAVAVALAVAAFVAARRSRLGAELEGGGGDFDWVTLRDQVRHRAEVMDQQQHVEAEPTPEPVLASAARPDRHAEPLEWLVSVLAEVRR